METLAEAPKGEGLPAYGAPATFLFAFAGPRIVGRVSIRHRLNERMALIGGHIGYVVVPEFRRKGCATAILTWALQFARDSLGLDRVLVTCDLNNQGSIRTIEKCGGVFEGLASTPDLDIPKRRCWIELSGGRGGSALHSRQS